MTRFSNEEPRRKRTGYRTSNIFWAFAKVIFRHLADRSIVGHRLDASASRLLLGEMMGYRKVKSERSGRSPSRL